MTVPTRQERAAALRFIVCLGIVSLFADMTYEGAASIFGPFLKDLGASGAQVGLIAGLGEMIAASLRYFSGRWVDRTRAYWGEAWRAGWGSPLSRGWAAAGACGDSLGCHAPAVSTGGCSAAGWPASGCSPSSVLRKSAARGPSRMLARLGLAIGENLLRELPVGLGSNTVRLVLEDRHALHRSLCEADRLADT